MRLAVDYKMMMQGDGDLPGALEWQDGPILTRPPAICLDHCQRAPLNRSVKPKLKERVDTMTLCTVEPALARLAGLAVR